MANGRNEDRDPDNLDFQTSLRLQPEMLKRLQELAKAMREATGFPTRRSVVIRMALERGIDSLERDYFRRK